MGVGIEAWWLWQGVGAFLEGDRREIRVTVRIRMKRLGRTHRPFYRICVIDQRKARDGQAIEEVGTYDPMVKDKSKRVTMNLDRIKYWISVGAQPSDKVAILMDKLENNRWGEVKAPPPAPAPKERPPKAAASTEGNEAPAEETPAAAEG